MQNQSLDTLDRIIRDNEVSINSTDTKALADTIDVDKCFCILDLHHKTVLEEETMESYEFFKIVKDKELQCIISRWTFEPTVPSNTYIKRGCFTFQVVNHGTV